MFCVLQKADDREKRQEAHRFHFDAMWETGESVVGKSWEDWVFRFGGLFIFTLFSTLEHFYAFNIVWNQRNTSKYEYFEQLCLCGSVDFWWEENT